jgi:hypothetical protein
MSQKNMAHDSEVTGRHFSFHSRELFVVFGFILVVVLAVAWVTVEPPANIAQSLPAAPVAAAPAVDYRDALAMADTQVSDPALSYEETLAIIQFAQPWLDPQAEPADLASRYIGNQVGSVAPALEAAPAVDYRDALAMADTQAGDTAVSYDEALAIIQFTQPWLDPQAEAADLAGRYIETQTVTNVPSAAAAPAADYREALAMSDTQSMLDKQLSGLSVNYDEALAVMAYLQPWLNPQAEPADLASRYIEALAANAQP